MWRVRSPFPTIPGSNGSFFFFFFFENTDVSPFSFFRVSMWAFMWIGREGHWESSKVEHAKSRLGNAINLLRLCTNIDSQQKFVSLFLWYHWRTRRKAAMALKTITLWCVFKGSVERSLLPRAIFLFFTRNKPWKSEDHLCTLFFTEMSKERLEKSERTPPVSWRLWALAYSHDRPYNFSCMSAVSKNRRFAVFLSALGCHLASKSLSWPAMQVSNKKQEFEQRKQIKLFDDFWVRAYRFDFAPRRRPRARSM